MIFDLYERGKNFSSVLVWVGGALLIISSLMITVEVLMRKFFSISLVGADEIAGYLFAIFTSIAFPYAAFHKANIRIDIFYRAFPRVGRIFLDLLAQIFLIGFVGLLTWGAFDLAAHSTVQQTRAITPLATPLAIPQGLWVLGLSIFLATLILIFITSLVALKQKKISEFESIAGALTSDEEINEELHEEFSETDDVTLGGK